MNKDNDNEKNNHPQPVDKDSNRLDKNAHQFFQVQNTPKGIFPMFYESSDPYIYDKKFYCDLPQVITPTKSFHYPFSIESFCQFDLLTMVFDLKNNCELLTDRKLNTLIHQDFINNLLELISPNLTQSSTNAKTDQLKKDILAIVERQEDIPIGKKSAFHNRSFYLRNSTYFRTSLNVETENQALQVKRKSRTMSGSMPRISTEEAKKIIAKTFNDITAIQVGKEHPHRQGITAKNVYEVLPYAKLGGNNFCQFIFPIDPSQEAKVNEKFEKPSKFIMKKKQNEDIYSLYQNDHLKTFNQSNENNIAEFYSYDKDYTLSSAHQSVLFNRFLIFVNREKKTAKFASISNKYTLKKFKKPAVRKIQGEEGDDDNDNTLLKKKRERDIVVIPKEIDEQSLLKRNQWIKQNGFPFEFVGQEIQEIDYAEVEEIKKERHIDEINISDEDKQVNPQKGEDEEEEDYFGQSDEDEDDKSSFSDRRSENDKEVNSRSRGSDNANEDNENNCEINNNQEEDEENEDALFSEKEEQDRNHSPKKHIQRKQEDESDADDD